MKQFVFVSVALKSLCSEFNLFVLIRFTHRASVQPSENVKFSSIKRFEYQEPFFGSRTFGIRLRD